ncbi:MAG TPA: hypothetical protein VF290_02570 [Pyrinomonadaceae bacterium]
MVNTSLTPIRAASILNLIPLRHGKSGNWQKTRLLGLNDRLRRETPLLGGDMPYNVKVELIENDYNYRSRLIITDDSGERDHWDGGEPEDNSFNRDWAWVAEELRAAYEQGKKDANCLVSD